MNHGCDRSRYRVLVSGGGGALAGAILFAILLLMPGDLQAQIEVGAVERMAAARAAVREAGVPVEMLESRIEEATAKGLPEERVALAAERHASGLIVAQSAIADSSADERLVLAAAAEAAEAGFDREAIRAVLRSSQPSQTARALVMLAELASQGIRTTGALEQVLTALGRGEEALDRLLLSAAEGRERNRAARQPHRPLGVSALPTNIPPMGVPGPGQQPARGAPTSIPANASAGTVGG